MKTGRRRIWDAACALAYAPLGLWLLWIGREGPLAFCAAMGLLYLGLAVLHGFDAAGVRKTKGMKEEKP